MDVNGVMMLLFVLVDAAAIHTILFILNSWYINAKLLPCWLVITPTNQAASYTLSLTK